MRLILGFMVCFVDRSLNDNHIFSLYMYDFSFFFGLFKISVSSFTSNICAIPGVEIWNP